MRRRADLRNRARAGGRTAVFRCNGNCTERLLHGIQSLAATSRVCVMSYAIAMDGKIERLKEGEFYGTIVRRAVVSGATLSIVRHNVANDLPVHAHDQPYFCLLVEGQYNETYADRTIAYHPFSIAL